MYVNISSMYFSPALALRAARAAGGQALKTMTIHAATRDAPGFEAAWAQAAGIPGWFDRVNAAAFWGVIRDCKPETTVEIGSYLGRSTALIGAAIKMHSTNAKLVSIDPHTGDRQQLEQVRAETLPTAELFQLHMRGIGLMDVLDIRVARSDDAAIGWDRPIDLLFIDGWHSYDAVLSDAMNWASHLSPDGIVCFDDAGNYAEVRAAVIDACSKLGLTAYGPVLAQAWAGRRATPPPSLAAAIRWSRALPESRRARFSSGVKR